MRENIALLDLDGTVADYDGALLEGLEKIHAPNEVWADTLRSLWLPRRPDWLHARVNLIRSVPGWWLNLKPLQIGFDIYHMLQELDFKVNVLTKGPDPDEIPTAWQEKAQWARHWLPGVRVTVCDYQKDNVYGRVLVDDYPQFAEAWLKFRPRGLVIMPVNPRNNGFCHPQVIKYDGDNETQVLRALEIVKAREDGQPLDLSPIR